MKTIVLAYHNIGCAGLEKLIEYGFDVKAVFTHKDDPHENVWFDSVAELAARHKIPVFAPEDINHFLWVQKIKDYKPDVLFSFYYRAMLKPALLEVPAVGCFNLHGSLLPRYRGRCPVNWVLINGEKETGVTLHCMTPRPDDGDIVGQRKILISDDDTAKTLYTKITSAAQDVLDQTLPAIKSKKFRRIPQDNSLASYYGGRRPEQGEINWQEPAECVRNVVRALTRPYPGAFTFLRNKKIFLWGVSVCAKAQGKKKPGTIVGLDPLRVACKEGEIQVDFAQAENGVYMSGAQLARDLNLTLGMQFGPQASRSADSLRKKRVLILGVNGFIGNALSEHLLASGKYEIHGMDIQSNHIERFLDKPGFHFYEGDISIHREWIEYHVRKCDIVLPLVAIATPIEYTRNPLRVFELDFEENVRVIRYCVKYKKRVIFPSTSEVYGMCADEEFDEEKSNLILGPISKQRWIYSCIKQLLDRVIWAYGQKEGLAFTLFRPFNWIGPRLDSLSSARIGSSRVITQLILNLVEGTPIQLVDGGEQKRCFTDVEDGIECLFRIIENNQGVCNGRIINIGNPENELSIKALAEMLVKKFDQHPLRAKFPASAGIRTIESITYYGEGYEDVSYRKPSIRNAQKLLDWKPGVSMEQSIENTLDFFLREAVKSFQKHNKNKK